MKLKNVILVLLIATIGGVVAIAGNKLFFEQKSQTTFINPYESQIARFANYTPIHVFQFFSCVHKHAR